MQRTALGCLFSLAVSVAQAACLPPPAGTTVETTPAALPDPGWEMREAAVEKLVRGGELSKIRLLFLGDSITEAWAPPVFQHFFDPNGSLNLGVRGAGTQQLLYTLQRLPLGTRLRPDVVVLLIGTNNLWPKVDIDNVVGGVATVLAQLQAKLPRAKIVLVDLLPRGEKADAPERAQIAAVNRGLAGCAAPGVIVTDPGVLLPERDGSLSKDVSYDALHLTWFGYAFIGAALAPVVNQALAKQP